MAKVTGPLFSLTASGKIGDAMVHFAWKGLNVVRGWVKPLNAESETQGDVRVILGGLGRATRCVGETSLYRDDAKLVQGDGQTWTSAFVKYIMSNYMKTAAEFEAMIVAYEAHAQKAVFETEALALNLAAFDVTYKGATGVFTAGRQLYMLGYYGIAMRLAHEGVFDRAPYTVALASWSEANVQALGADVLSV